MATTERFHGTRVFKEGQTARPVEVTDYSTCGTVMVSPNADPDVFPLDELVTVFTNDTAVRTAAGTGGNVDAIFDAIDDQGIVDCFLQVAIDFHAVQRSNQRHGTVQEVNQAILDFLAPCVRRSIPCGISRGFRASMTAPRSRPAQPPAAAP